MYHIYILEHDTLQKSMRPQFLPKAYDTMQKHASHMMPCTTFCKRILSTFKCPTVIGDTCKIPYLCNNM